MAIDPRSLILFACNALLLFLMLLVNSALASWSLYLFVLGPMLVIPALYLKHLSFFICTLLTGLCIDAALPAAFGFFTILFLSLGTAIYMLRHRFRTEHNSHPILLAHGCNFACLIALSLLNSSTYFIVPAFWIHLSITLVISHLMLIMVAPWFFNFERLMFQICRLETEPEDLPMT